MTKKRLTVIGHTGIDYNIQVNKEENKLSTPVTSFSKTIGGTGCNVATSANLFNIPVTLDTIMDYKDWELLKNDLAYNPLNYIRVFHKPDKTPRCFIITEEDDTVKGYIHDPTLPLWDSLLDNTVFINKTLKNSENNIIHFTTTPPQFTVNSIKHINQEDTRVSWSPGQNTYLWTTENIKQMLQYTSILFVNHKEYDLIHTKLNDDEPLKYMKKDSFIIVTDGGNGCDILLKDNKIHVDAYTPEQVIDSTGCGDAFTGAFLANLLKDKSLKESAMIGNSVASFIIEKEGCQTNLPTKEMIQNRINNYGLGGNTESSKPTGLL